MNMDKLKYDSFYKFLVSLGVILITLPFAGLIYISNFKVTLINEKDYEKLSEFSRNSLEQKQQIFENLNSLLSNSAPFLFAFGIVFFTVGAWNWAKIQLLLDEQVNSDTKKKEFEVQQLTPLEILNEQIREVEEENAEEENNKPEITQTNNAAENSENKADASVGINGHSVQDFTDPIYIDHTARLIKNIQVEKNVCKILSEKYSQTHDFKSQARINGFIFDAIAFSKNDDNDIIFEIKNYGRPTGILPLQSISRILSAKTNYSDIYKRKCKLVFIIVTPKEIIPKMKYLKQQLSSKNISCEFWKEEDVLNIN